MPTLTPTKADGATTKPMPAVYVEPVAATDDATLAIPFEGTALNGAFCADLLSAALTHERCSVHLYRTVAERSNNAILQSKYKDFGTQTLRHVEILESITTSMGANPNYVSPMARAVQGMDSKLLESTFMLEGSVPVMDQEMVMLDAVFLAETAAHANWGALSALAAELPDGPLRRSFEDAAAEAGHHKDEHLRWARSTKSKLVLLQARSSKIAAAGEKVEEMVATVRGWLS